MAVKIGSPQDKFQFNNTYDIELTIKNLNYSRDVLQVVIGNSLITAYPVIELMLLVDVNDIHLEKLYGNDPIKLTITLKGYDNDFGSPGPSYTFDLMMIKGKFGLTEKAMDFPEQSQKERTPYTMTCLVRKPFQIMTTLVNEVYLGRSISQIFDDLASKVGARIAYDRDNLNSEIIDQVCIPPTTLYNIIKEHAPESNNLYDGFLDARFGLYPNPTATYCDFEGVVKIKNLTNKMKASQAFTIYHLPTKGKDIGEIISKCVDGKHFYTYDKIITEYAGPAKFGNIANSIKNVVKPKDSLSQIIEQNLEDIAKNNSISYFPNKQVSIPHNNSLNRQRFYVNDTGYEKTTTPFLSRYSRLMADLASISFRLEKNLRIFGLMEVGESVKLETNNLEYKDYEGKYILWSSSISFSREVDWISRARINLIRTNKYI